MGKILLRVLLYPQEQRAFIPILGLYQGTGQPRQNAENPGKFEQNPATAIAEAVQLAGEAFQEQNHSTSRKSRSA